MSHQGFIDFLEAVNTDPELQERIDGLRDGTLEKVVAQLIDIGQTSGFTFTEREMDELLLAHAAAEAGEELTPEELESVAGGFVATSEMQEMNMSFNLQYLGLQQKMQGENRQFTLLSTIMKTKHDRAKSAINNIR